ncbi:hypothetical protein [Streptomyces sp. AGS-58]|uniref:hypothetical protein n=1 Tax=unclassified Streptomyces TaxID=2593676 RepID=UPI0035A2D0D5
MGGSPQHGSDDARRRAAERWLLRAAPSEETALKEWDSGVAVLVAGHSWDAVRVPYRLLDPTFDYDTEPEALRVCVTRLRLVGPAFCDPYRPYTYFLVPPGSDAHWPREEFVADEVECLGGTEPYVRHVGVPRVDRVKRPGLFWLTPPDTVAFRYVDPTHLLFVLRTHRHATASQAVR